VRVVDDETSILIKMYQSAYSQVLLEKFAVEHTAQDADLFVLSMVLVGAFYALKFRSLLLAVAGMSVVLLAIPVA